MSHLDLEDAVTLRWRKDGWTPEKQAGFLERLAESGSVDQAAASVGMSASSAYRLRGREGGDAFRAAWTEAVGIAWHQLHETAVQRCRHGTRHPVRYRGEVIGERLAYSDKLLMFMLDRLRPAELSPEALAAREARRAEENARNMKSKALAWLNETFREIDIGKAQAEVARAIGEAELGPLFPSLCRAAPPAAVDAELSRGNPEVECGNGAFSRELSQSGGAPESADAEFDRRWPALAATPPAPSRGTPPCDPHDDPCSDEYVTREITDIFSPHHARYKTAAAGPPAGGYPSG